MRLLTAFLLLVAACNGDRHYTLTAPDVTVEIDARPFRFTVLDKDRKPVLVSSEAFGAAAWTTGRMEWNSGTHGILGHQALDAILDPWRAGHELLSAEQASDSEITLHLDQGIRLRLAASDGTLRIEAAREEADRPRAWAFSFKSPEDEAFLGFGERFNKSDQRGLNLYSWHEEGGFGSGENAPVGPRNPWPNGETMTYYAVPFFVSSRGYGFWLDSTWRNEFRLATDSPHSWRVWDIGPTLAAEIYLPRSNDARAWPYHVVDRFTAKTGRPMIPPAWSFGPRRRVGTSSMVNGVREVQYMRDLDLAITAVDDAVHFLPKGSEIGREAELKQWTTDAAALGYRVCGYYNAYVAKADSPLSALRDEGLQKKWFLFNADGTPSVVYFISGEPLDLYTFDVTKAEARTAYGREFSRALTLGYSCWMYDFGEYVQPQVLAGNGMTGEELHNLWPALYDQAGYEALEAGPAKGDWFFFARSGYTGSQKWTPMVWGGDPESSFDDGLGLPSIIRGGTNMGLSGVAHWGSDIGGFKCISGGYAAADGEMLTRWIEAGALMSNMQDQNACPGAKDSGIKASIWNSPDAQAAWKTYARLHTRLFPYMFTLAKEANATGAPAMRHPFFEHPTRDFAAVDDAYYFGPSLLVAPVVRRGARGREVMLPATSFLDWTATPPSVVSGPGKKVLDVPLGRLPVLIKSGALVPLLDATIDTLDDRETSAQVVGPKDVADVYDVVGFLGPESASATFTAHDGSRFSAALPGAVPSGPGVERVSAKLVRVRATIPPGGAPFVLGALRLEASSARTVRFEIFVAEP